MQITSLFSVLLSTAVLAFTLATPVHAAGVTGQGTWETTLLARDLNGDTVTDAFYDTKLNITWLRNANTHGLMKWHDANAWAAGYSIGGYSGWRLPTMTDTGPPGCDLSLYGTDCGYNPATSTSEMASLFFDTLGNKSRFNISGVEQSGYGLTNTGGFQNMQSDDYWLGIRYAPQPYAAWYFITVNGSQYAANGGYDLYAMVVRPGDVVMASVPEPETYLMLSLGLGMIGALARRCKSKSS